MRNGATLRVFDTGELDIAPRIELELFAGILEEDYGKQHPNSDLSIGDLALVHEMGLGNNPMRAPVRRWSYRYETKLRRKVRAALKEAARKQKWSSGPIKQIADSAARSLKSDFYRGKIKPGLKPRALARKAPEKRPLVDTKTLAQHMRVRVKFARRGFKRGGTRIYKYVSK